MRKDIDTNCCDTLQCHSTEDAEKVDKQMPTTKNDELKDEQSNRNTTSKGLKLKELAEEIKMQIENDIFKVYTCNNAEEFEDKELDCDTNGMLLEELEKHLLINESSNS